MGLSVMNTFDEITTNALRDQRPIRLFLNPLTRLFDSTDYRGSVEAFVQNQLGDILRSAIVDTECQLLLQPLAIEIWGRRTLIVVDVNYYGYDWHTAHDLKTNMLEVYRLVLEKEGKNAAIRRDKTLDLRVNRQGAELHRLNGVLRPPYLADHSPGADPVQYRSLRPSLPESYPNERTAEQERVGEEVGSIMQRLAISTYASMQASKERVDTFTDISMVGSCHQVLVSTSGNIILGGRITTEARSQQCSGQLSEESLQNVARDQRTTGTVESIEPQKEESGSWDTPKVLGASQVVRD